MNDTVEYWYNQILIAEKFAHTRHSGQTRRDGVTPYITHPKGAVQIACKRFAQDSGGRSLVDLYKVVAILWTHDLKEDTGATREDFESAGLDRFVYDGTDMVSKREGEAYPDRLRAIKELGLWHVIEAKTCDILANLTDGPTAKQFVKYGNALAYLYG